MARPAAHPYSVTVSDGERLFGPLGKEVRYASVT